MGKEKKNNVFVAVVTPQLYVLVTTGEKKIHFKNSQKTTSFKLLTFSWPILQVGKLGWSTAGCSPPDPP